TLHHRIIHDAGGHADHGVVLDRAGMDHRHMADHHPAADFGPLPLARDMNDRAVLNVRPLAHTDVIGVAAQHAIEPDAGAGADSDVTDDHRIVGDEGIRSYSRQLI